MRIKKYKAKSLTKGKQLVKRELGSDAVVLSSRTGRDPATGETFVELVAAIDDSPVAKKQAPAEAQPPKPRQRELDPDAKTFVKTAGNIFSEIEKIKGLISGVSESVKYKYAGSLGEISGKIFVALRQSGIEENLALKIAGEISADPEITDLEKAIPLARKLALNNIECIESLQASDKRRVAAFIGTTGSGKTTTLIKLAIITRLVMQSRVMVISADTQKVGGAEQLETYASIANLPYRSAYSPKELGDIINSEKNYDFIFIDTTGRSQQNQKHLKEINEYISNAGADSVFLVQNATANSSTFRQVMDNFAFIKPTALVLTRLDEAAAIGEIITVLNEKPLPMIYFSNGQQIPEDIEPASKSRLGEMLLPGEIGFYSATNSNSVEK